MKWLFKDMSLCESFIQVKIKLRHQAKEYYFSPSCESGWQHNIGYGVYVVMSYIYDWKNDCVSLQNFLCYMWERKLIKMEKKGTISCLHFCKSIGFYFVYKVLIDTRL